MIVIPNQNLFKIADENTSFVEAFKMADDVLYSAVRGVTDLIVLPGLVNLDFADIQAVMKETGKAVIATGEAEGDRRAIEAAEKAIANPLLDSPSIRGARGLLINITGGSDMALFEVDVAANRVRAEVDDGCFTIFGSALDESLDGKLRVSVVASGIGATDTAHEAPPEFGVEPSGEPPQEETEQTREESEETLLPLPETAESEAEPEIEDEESPADKLGILKVPSTVTLAELGEPRSAAPEKLTPENFAPENIGLENIAIEPAANDPVPTSGAEGEEPSTRSPENDEVAKDGDPFLAAVQEGVKAANPETDEEGGKGLLGRVSRLFKS
jgi:cell division protein FtsZ